MSKARAYCWTLNNYTEEELNHAESFHDATPTCEYLLFGKETGDQEGTPHLQGYVYFKNPRTIKGLKRTTLFKRAHLEVAQGTPTQNKVYCTKSGDWSEYGTLPNPGARNDIKQYITDIKSGLGDVELAEKHPGCFARYPRVINRLRLAMAREKEKEYKQPEVVVYWGDTGCGKTRRAYSEDPDLFSVPVPSNNTLWFDGYQDQKTILLDDFYGWIRLGHLLRILDGYPMDLPVKGSFVRKQWSKVIITSNCHPSRWYANQPARKMQALSRRLQTIEHMEAPAPTETVTWSDNYVDPPVQEGDRWEG